MFRRTVCTLLALPALSLLLAAPALAQGYAFPVDIRPQPLSSALRDLARQTGSELLYDQDVLRGMRAPRLRSRLTVEASLRQLLAGTDLTTRRASSGAWVIERRRPPARPPTARPAREPPPVDLPAPEILVTARLSQNADIQRRENDVQPYQVTTGDEIVRAHRDNLDQFFGSRVTANTQVLPPRLGDLGETKSAIDLRGFGVEGTMVLIDGRRMPGVPDALTNLGQPDLSAVPLHAIERIETLTGTAGGIHGFGALGGVVNVVLDRDYRGAEFHASGGVSARGDAERLSLEGRVGFTPDGGRTDVMLYAGWSAERPLLIGERDFTQRNRELTYRNDPFYAMVSLPGFNGIVATHMFRGPDDPAPAPLTLKPEYGGAILGADFTYLPLGFAGEPADLAAILAQNAGTVDFSLVDTEAASQLGSSTRTLSVIGSVRHDFGDGFEGYLDGLYLRNRGENFGHSGLIELAMSPDAPQNPFNEYVSVTLPAPREDGRIAKVFDSTRLTGGLIFPLPWEWLGTAEATYGDASFDHAGGTDNAYVGPFLLFGFPDDDPELTPFGKWDDFVRAASKYLIDAHSRELGRNRYEEQSLRLAGPLFEAGGGPATLALLVQRRRERAKYRQALISDTDIIDDFDQQISARSIGEESLYAEIRLPVFGQDAPLPLTHDLELQLAVRHDRQTYRYARNPYEPEPSDFFRRTMAGTAFTAGAKVHPLPWLMLRGSYATGVQPPPLHLLMIRETEEDLYFLSDPKRGNAWFTDEGAYTELSNGNPDLDLVKASTLSLGGVVNPSGDGGPRFSIDFSRVRRSGDPIILFPEAILEHEESWPDRVVRDPLTDQDRALGYTAGKVTLLDWTAMNAGRTSVDTLDAAIDWTVPVLGGTLRTYGLVTWQLSHATTEPFGEKVERVGYRNGPLEWRANGGFDFTVGPTTVGANLQYFDRYLIYQQELACCSQTDVLMQGSQWVASQTYLDLYVGHRVPIGKIDATIDLGIVNVLDQRPPREIAILSQGAQYSMYGDPRRRRFELVLSAEF